MKKLTRVLSIVLSGIMVFSVIAVAAACVRGKPVKITYQNKGREIATYEVKSKKKIPEQFVAPDPIPDSNEVFLYWSDAPDGKKDFVATSKPTKDTTLYSVYRERKENEVVVVFLTDGGNNIKSQVLMKGEKITKPADPQKAGAEFDKWQANEESDVFDFNTPIQKDVILRALWIEGKNQILTLSSGNLDKVFSPFFGTSAYDSEIQGNAHISMLSANADGQVFVGEETPTAVKSFTETVFINNAPIDPKYVNSEVNKLGEDQKTDPTKCRTEYEFTIKNNIRFSDGSKLTIKDVLFNMYVYLDPVYTGSSTMYSTNIIGLNAYRTQIKGADDVGNADNSVAINNAGNRMTNLRDYFSSDGSRRQQTRDEMDKATDKTEELQVFKDLQALRENLWRELKSDWNSCNMIEDIQKDYEEYGFTEPWEVFLFNCRIITAEYNQNGTVKIDEQTLKPKVNYAGYEDYFHDENLVTIVFNSKLGILEDDERGNYLRASSGVPKSDLKFDLAGNVIGSEFNMGGIADKGGNTTTNTLIARFTTIPYEAQLTANEGVTDISRSWQAGQKLSADILADETGKVLQKIKDAGGNEVPTITGITADTRDGHDILKVSIVGVDPKAIWNFGFIVAPMSYYSNPSNKTTGFVPADGYTSFNYPGTEGYDQGKPIHLGFKQFDLDYFNKVINHTDVQGLPMGAGAFKVTDISGGDEPVPTSFCADNVVYFKRNDYFFTTGTGMNNVRFEYLRYQVVDTPKIMDALETGTVHFGDPSATSKNVDKAQASPELTNRRVKNNGFGYVGVNADFVRDKEIRQAIMYAMNTDHILSYYVNELAEVIYRPMSTVSWAYPHEAVDRYPYNSAEAVVPEINKLVTAAGYSNETLHEGAWTKTTPDQEVRHLKITFTIAGTSTDHPAFLMFDNAKKILNQCGFVVTVKNDPFALSRLATGGLAVWAAAWGGGIDPDMYQVYHPQSKASSVKNWGYPYLLQYGTTGEGGEKEILEDLGDLIDQGRQSLDRNVRKSIYSDALDKVMELAVEYPTYQRNNLYVYNHTKIDATTLNQNPTAYTGLLAYIWKVKLLK